MNGNLETNATSWPVDTQPSPIEGGTYTCIITDANGNTITTNPATLTLQTPLVGPTTIANDYTGELEFEITDVPVGGTVRLEKYLDNDGEGQIGATEPLTQSLRLTDGYLPTIGGVRNTSVPGDEDNATLDGIIKMEIPFQAQSEINQLAAHYIYRVVQDDTNATLQQRPFVITQPNLSQMVTGKVMSGEQPIAHASVYLQSLDGKLHLAHADAAGNYAIKVPAGDYRCGAIALGKPYILHQPEHDGTDLISVADGVNTQRNFNLIAAPRTITGRVTDSDGHALPGFLLQIEDEAERGYFTLAITDAQGNYTAYIPHYPWNWEIYAGWLDGALHGLCYEEREVHTKNLNSIQVDLSLQRAEALITGSLRDQNHNPLGGMILEADGNVGVSDVHTGVYSIGVRGGHAHWIGYDGDSFIPRGYFGPSHSTPQINSGEVQYHDLNATPFTAYLKGRVVDEQGNPIRGMDFEAKRSGGNYLRSVVATDSNGNFKLGVIDGQWKISIDSDNAAEQGLLSHQSYEIVATNGSDVENITYTAKRGDTEFKLVMRDIMGRPIPNVDIWLNRPDPRGGELNYSVSIEPDDNGTAILNLLEI